MRRLMRFSLKTLLAFMAIFSIWLGMHVRSARLQKEAVKAIQEHDVRVAYDFQYDQTNSWVPSWLRQKLGDDFFHSVVDVSFWPRYQGKAVVDVSYWPRYPGKAMEVRQTPAMPPLRELLAGFPKIRCLRLWSTQVTDENIKVLANLDSLERVVVFDPENISDKGDVYRKAINHLEWSVVWQEK